METIEELEESRTHNLEEEEFKVKAFETNLVVGMTVKRLEEMIRDI